MRVLVNFGIGGGHSSPIRSRNLANALARKPGFEVEIATGREISANFERFRPDVLFARGFRHWVPYVGRARVVSDIHGDRASELLDRQWSPLRRWQAFARTRIDERRFAARADGYTVVSEGLAARVRRFGPPVELIPGGVDLELFRPRRAPPRERIRITYAGSFRSYQGIPSLLDAFEILNRAGELFELELVGDPGELSARAAATPGVILTAQVAHERIPEILGRADILALPRPDSRPARFGFPGKLAEYMAMGKAIIATNVGDHGRMILDAETGILVPAGSAQHLADGLRRLSDANVRARLGAAARRVAEDKLSWDEAARVLATLLERVVAQRSSDPPPTRRVSAG
jgi:glycosyltransferase involved in cell wall biosynthesis